MPDALASRLEALKATGVVPTILVNNAGVEDVAPSADVTEALWDEIVGTNLKAAFFVAQAFARPLLAAQRSGAIINLGSLTSAVGIPTATPYTASKSGVLGMTRALAAEWAPAIRVNAIGPGYFRTAMTEGFYQMTRTGRRRCWARSRCAASASSTTSSACRSSWPATHPHT